MEKTNNLISIIQSSSFFVKSFYLQFYKMPSAKKSKISSKCRVQGQFLIVTVWPPKQLWKIHQLDNWGTCHLPKAHERIPLLNADWIFHTTLPCLNLSDFRTCGSSLFIYCNCRNCHEFLFFLFQITSYWFLYSLSFYLSWKVQMWYLYQSSAYLHYFSFFLYSFIKKKFLSFYLFCWIHIATHISKLVTLDIIQQSSKQLDNKDLK